MQSELEALAGVTTTLTVENLFVRLLHKCYNFGENVILGLGSEGNFMWMGGGIKGKTPLGRRADVRVSARNGEEPASVNSGITGAI